MRESGKCFYNESLTPSNPSENSHIKSPWKAKQQKGKVTAIFTQSHCCKLNKVDLHKCNECILKHIKHRNKKASNLLCRTQHKRQKSWTPQWAKNIERIANCGHFPTFPIYPPLFSFMCFLWSGHIITHNAPILPVDVLFAFSEFLRGKINSSFFCNPIFCAMWIFCLCGCCCFV